MIVVNSELYLKGGVWQKPDTISQSESKQLSLGLNHFFLKLKENFVSFLIRLSKKDK